MQESFIEFGQAVSETTSFEITAENGERKTHFVEVKLKTFYQSIELLTRTYVTKLNFQVPKSDF